MLYADDGIADIADVADVADGAGPDALVVAAAAVVVVETDVVFAGRERSRKNWALLLRARYDWSAFASNELFALLYRLLLLEVAMLLEAEGPILDVFENDVLANDAVEVERGSENITLLPKARLLEGPAARYEELRGCV